MAWAAIAKKWVRFCHLTLFWSQLQIGFIYQRGGLQGVVGALAAQVTLGLQVQLAIDESGSNSSRASLLPSLQSCRISVISVDRLIFGFSG
jgi:hypothetical protein